MIQQGVLEVEEVKGCRFGGLALKITVLEQTSNSIKLHVKGAPLHLINSIRRAAMSEVPTMAIDYVILSRTQAFSMTSTLRTGSV